jgi:Flp pilus assembly protein TadD
MKSTVRCCCWLLAGSAMLSAQKTGPVPTRPTVGTPGLPTAPNPNTNNTNNNTNFPLSTTNGNNTIARPIYLSGKVILQDGTAPPDFVKIERICGGTPHPQGYTDTKGRFNFQVDSPFGLGQDASDPMASSSSLGRPGSSMAARGMLAGCDLRAVLPGFFSSTISLYNRTEFDNPDVGTIILKRVGNVEGTTISMSSLNAPKDALKAFDKGRELLKKEKSDEAERSFQKAVDLYPKYAVAWYQLGLLQSRKERELAEMSFAKAMESDPKYISPYLSLALMSVQSKNWSKVLDLSDAVIKLNPKDFPQAYFYKAVAHYNMQNDADAEKSVRKAIEIDLRQDNPQSEKLLGFILIQHKNFPDAAEHLNKYLELQPNANDVPQVKAQLVNLQKQSVAAK